MATHFDIFEMEQEDAVVGISGAKSGSRREFHRPFNRSVLVCKVAEPCDEFFHVPEFEFFILEEFFDLWMLGTEFVVMQ